METISQNPCAWQRPTDTCVSARRGRCRLGGVSYWIEVGPDFNVAEAWEADDTASTEACSWQSWPARGENHPPCPLRRGWGMRVENNSALNSYLIWCRRKKLNTWPSREQGCTLFYFLTSWFNCFFLMRTVTRSLRAFDMCRRVLPRRNKSTTQTNKDTLCSHYCFFFSYPSFLQS